MCGMLKSIWTQRRSLQLHLTRHLLEHHLDISDVYAFVFGDTQHAADQLLHVGADLQRRRESAALRYVFLQGLEPVPDVPRHEPAQRLIEHNAQAPHVALDAVGLARQDLRSHVAGRADAGGGHSFLLDDFNEAKVCNFNNT